jgi:Outer membrane protein beta-barrel domain
MKNVFCVIAFLALTLLSGSVYSQDKEKILAAGEEKDLFQKKFSWGLSWNQYWGTFKGSNLPQTYFAKPCMGFNVRAEYYPLSFIGVGVGVGIQQRGAGVINSDNSGGAFTHPWEIPQFDGDSTYRERIRLNTIEIPLTLLLRTPKDLIKGMRLSGAAGIVYTHAYSQKDYFLSVEDGYHKIVDVSNSFTPNDLGYQFSIGPEIEAGESCVFQVHFVYTTGGKNVFQNIAADGRQKTFGFRVACLF